MARYIFKRILYMILTIFMVVTLTFFLMRSIPGDPLASMARTLPEQTRANFYAKYGLDQPLFTQYLMYLKGLIHMDLGESLLYPGRTVSSVIAGTSPVSGSVGGLALLAGVLIGAFLGIIAALNKNRWPDYIVMFLAILGATVPVFVLTSLMQYVFAVRLGWLPASGWGRPVNYIMPVIVLAFGSIATYARYIKSSVLDTLGQDYVLTAQAKGLGRRDVIVKHVLRNSLLPAVTLLSSSIVAVFTGSFVLERMFSIPGIGFYYVSSINNNDYTMVLGTTVFYAALFIMMQLVCDFAYMILDPRIRLRADR